MWARADGAVHVAGEPVFLDADGDLAQCADDPTTIAGVALAPVARISGFFNPATGAAWTTGDNTPYVAATEGQLFITDNFATDGNGTPAAPTRAHIGDLAGVTRVTGPPIVYFVDVGAALLMNTIIVDVLDTNLESLQSPNSTGTGVHVVFRFNAGEDTVNIQWQGSR
jgi:hypothetical protein